MECTSANLVRGGESDYARITLVTPSEGESSLQATLCRATGVGGSLHFGPVTLQEVLNVNVTGTLKQTVLELWSHGGGESRGLEGTGTEDVSMSDGKDADDERDRKSVV